MSPALPSPSRPSGRIAIASACGIVVGLVGGCSGLLGLDEFTADVSDGATGATTSTGTSTTQASGVTSGGGAGGDDATTSVTAGPGGGDGGASTTGGEGGSGGAGGAGGQGPDPIVCEPGTNTNAFGTCDLLDPGSCPSGDRCSFVDDDGTLGCIPANGGARGLSEVCTSDGDCSGDLFCLDGRCSTFCCPGNDDPCDSIEGGFCNRNVGAPGEPDVYARACSFVEVCEPLLDDCDAADRHCIVADFDTQEAYCYPVPQPKAEGEACMYLNDCGESAICASDGAGGGVCRQLCDLDDWQTSVVPTGGCPTGRTCVSLGFLADWEHIGLCQP